MEGMKKLVICAMFALLSPVAWAAPLTATASVNVTSDTAAQAKINIAPIRPERPSGAGFLTVILSPFFVNRKILYHNFRRERP